MCNDPRFEKAIQSGNAAFWAAFTSHFSEVWPGTVDSDLTATLMPVLREVGGRWVRANAAAEESSAVDLDSWLALWNLQRVAVGSGAVGWRYELADGRLLYLTYGAGLEPDTHQLEEAAWYLSLFGHGTNVWVLFGPNTLANALSELGPILRLRPDHHPQVQGQKFESIGELLATN